MSSNALTFKGGIHPPHFKKQTEKTAIEKAKLPDEVILPMSQHIGAPCTPLVKAGDEVKKGQKIGEPGGFVSAAVFSTISGTVKAVEDRRTCTGMNSICIIIESDGKDEIHESVKAQGTIESLSGKEILEIISSAGITGMGGAGFPSHVKLSPPEDKKIDILIINGAECEPYLTSDHRVMLEMPEKIIRGTQAVMKVLNVEKAVIGVENNKKDAIKVLRDKLKEMSTAGITVAELKTKYPQGGEKSLIYAVTKKQVPSGGLPMDVGAVVQNISTVAAISDAVDKGMPVIERVVTVTGNGITNPKNLLVRMGTKFSDLVEQCGGYTEDAAKIINGGPMMGIAQATDQVSVIKGTSGILVLNEKSALRPEPDNCIRCGKCVEACPSGLMPLMISRNVLLNRIDEAQKYNALDCIECGSCSFICPSNRPLVDAIRIGKKEIISRKKKA